MKIIFKYILKSMAEKKLRTFLILISVAISSALFFASSAISTSMVSMFNERMKQYYGSCDFMIHGNGGISSRTLSPENAKPYEEQLEYIIGGFQGSAEYKDTDGESHTIALKGMEPSKENVVSPVIINEDLSLYPFEGKKIVISNMTAERFNWQLGDTIDIKVNNFKHKFTVSGIAEPVGFLFDDGESNCAIVPDNTLSSLYGMRGRYNVLYVKLKNPQEKRMILDKFRNTYKNCGFSWFSMTTDIDIPLKLLTVIVCFMSVFIIYTTFKVLTLERLPAIGTFRSIGATRKTTSMLLLAESITYGMIGGIFGSALGIGVLYIMASTTKNSWTSNMKTSITYNPIQLLTALGIALVLCFTSSLIPIIKVSRISIKEIIFNILEKQYKKGSGKVISGIGLLITALVLPNLIPQQFALYIDMGCLILLSISAVLLIPFLIRFIVMITEKAYVLVFGNIGVLAAKNLRENKNISNSIALLSIGISTLLLVTTATDSMAREVINTYNSNYNYDIHFRYSRANKYIEQVIRSIDGVSGTNGLISARGVNVQGLNERIQQIDGLGSTRYFDFWKIDAGIDPVTILSELDAGRNMLISNSLNFILGLKEGDRITLELPKGERVYKVIGFYDTSLNDGNHALASERFINLDTGNKYYSAINIKTSKEPAIVAEDIKKVFNRENPSVDTIEELEQQSMAENRKFSNILSGFAILTFLIGVIGVFNNLLIFFIERKHSLAVLKSIGMSRLQTLKMVFIEALTGGMAGGIIGTIAGSLQLLIVPKILRATGQYFPIHYNLNIIIIFIVTGMIITLIASIGPALTSSKLDIVSSLKYE